MYRLVRVQMHELSEAPIELTQSFRDLNFFFAVNNFHVCIAFYSAQQSCHRRRRLGRHVPPVTGVDSHLPALRLRISECDLNKCTYVIRWHGHACMGTSSRLKTRIQMYLFRRNADAMFYTHYTFQFPVKILFPYTASPPPPCESH